VALANHDELLSALRAVEGIKEVSHGRFYRRSNAFLHFHGGDAERWADVRVGDDWQRVRVATAKERAALVTLVKRAVAPS
jgi:hypothetical protein